MCLSLSAAEVVKEADARALNSIVSFLASDALEGRDTPSAGLTVASEYIASEFRRVGLKTSFQTSKFTLRRVVREGYEFSLTDGTKTVQVPADAAQWSPGPKVDLSGATVRKLKVAELRDATFTTMDPVVVLEGPGAPGMQQGIQKLLAAGAKVIVFAGIPMPVPVQTLEFDDQPKTNAVLLRTTSAEAEALMKDATSLKATVKLAEASSRASEARNVIGILTGSDPVLKDEYVLVTAHYDHVGIRPNEPGDKIFNGANDNASGVASVIESARILSQLPTAPKRSVMFVTFFGEERGMLGSRFFVRNPVVPLKQMVANLNLEQTGRSDASDGKNVDQFNLTGYHFTNIHTFMEEAAKATGLKAVKHEQFSDPFYQASDNIAFAPAGVPATTLSVTYQFPDYHQKGDEAEKLDYPNMAKVTRGIAQGAYLMAETAEKLVWNETDPKVKAYREAAAKR